MSIKTKVLIAPIVALLFGCTTTPTQRADHLAARAGFTRQLLLGDKFHHAAYERVGPSDRLFLYIEGDGAPWVRHGREIATDPTPRHALALELATRSGSASILYLGRPCYLGLAASSECHTSDWTFDRYSGDIVRSLVACTNRYIENKGIREVILIGHSGGGTLAILMAPQVSHLRAVITIAANLDVKSWTAYHGYMRLVGSLDPVDTAPLPAGITEIHLAGGADTNVPPTLIRRYLAGHPGAQLRTFARFDHRCCWQDAWPTLLPELVHAALIDGS